MYYSLEEAKTKVLEAGSKLVCNGLVARTWGNISARISEDEFVVTPSGRAYDELSEKDLVVVKVSDASYDGNIKPSSESKLHAACYRCRPDISFIIHTHQLYATAISVTGKDYDFAPCAAYALPGTKGLKNAVEEQVKKHPNQNAFLMKSHGALCLGPGYCEAFVEAESLEEKSKEVFLSCCGGQLESFSADDTADNSLIKAAFSKGSKLKAYLDDYAQIAGFSKSLDSIHDQMKAGDGEALSMILVKNCAAKLYADANGAKAMNVFDAMLQNAVYKLKYSKLNDSNR